MGNVWSKIGKNLLSNIWTIPYYIISTNRLLLAVDEDLLAPRSLSPPECRAAAAAARRRNSSCSTANLSMRARISPSSQMSELK